MLVLAVVLPLAAWSAVSYVPWIWHPMVQVVDAGETGLEEGRRYQRGVLADANAALAAGAAPAAGFRANPVFLPAPHEVARGFYRLFTRAPQLSGDQWFHESVAHSLRVIFWGFFWSCLIGVPLGLLAGTFSAASKLLEPPIDFVRYMPAPVFGALMVAIFGLADAPKVAIIFIGTFFQMVLIVANTTRRLDRSLLEAAQTLGAGRGQLVRHVIVPGVLPQLYTDLRILLGWAWTYLIVAELIGAKSGVTAFIATQSRYFNFDLVYAAIIVIGVIGLVTDQTLQYGARFLFPWQRRPVGPVARAVWDALTFVPRRAVAALRPAAAARPVAAPALAPERRSVPAASSVERSSVAAALPSEGLNVAAS
jgi:NitT/TauT family transport system permease protein